MFLVCLSEWLPQAQWLLKKCLYEISKFVVFRDQMSCITIMHQNESVEPTNGPVCPTACLVRVTDGTELFGEATVSTNGVKLGC